MHQIATDSSQKIPQRLPPSALAAMRQGLSFQRLAFAAAAWMRYARGVDEQGQAYALNDPLAAQVQQLATANMGDAAAAAKALGSLCDVWGSDLPQMPAWMNAVTHWLAAIERDGILAAIAQVNRGGSDGHSGGGAQAAL